MKSKNIKTVPESPINKDYDGEKTFEKNVLKEIMHNHSEFSEFELPKFELSELFSCTNLKKLIHFKNVYVFNFI